MNRYDIWDKKSDVYTPSGAVFTAEEWLKKYPIAKKDDVIVVCSAGSINGGYFGILDEMKKRAIGCDFTGCKTPQDELMRIEEFEAAKHSAEVAAREAKAAEAAEQEAVKISSLASIAAQLEYQNMMTLEDVEEV